MSVLKRWNGSNWEVIGPAIKNTGSSITEEIKLALLQLASKVAYIDENGQTYYNSLQNALYNVAVESINAVFTQGQAVIYDTDSLDTLKQYLTVTATYADSSTETVMIYALSGTLAAGTSTITVSYGGKTTTFDVTVSLGLDSIAYGTLTYRDIFITNNMLTLGDFESAMTLNSTWQNVGENWRYKINSGSPVISTEESNSPTHSLKCFGTASSQISYVNSADSFSGSFLCCISIKCDRYEQGGAGVIIYAPVQNSIERIYLDVEETTDDFVPVVSILTLDGTRVGMGSYIGTYNSANCDAYIDDVVITPLPSGMTQAQGEQLYQQYLTIRRAS